MIELVNDAAVLRRAAIILRRESRKPDGVWMRVFCRLLTDTADKIDRREGIL